MGREGTLTPLARASGTLRLSGGHPLGPGRNTANAQVPLKARQRRFLKEGSQCLST